MSTASLSSQALEAFYPVRAGGLPIFRRDCSEYVTFYTPGWLCVVDLPDAGRFEATLTLPAREADGPVQGVNWAGELRRWAELTTVKARAFHEEPFRPECLTLYLNNECNLHCVYCYAEPSLEPAIRLGLEAIAAAAEVVAANCREKGIPFHVVFHGGGEPTLHRGQVESILGLIDQVASAHQAETFLYVSTNGVMPEEKAMWLAHRFDLVGLSCDGPPDIHDSHRPNRDDEGTSHLLERTAHVLRQEGTPFHVRATITAASLQRQAEVAEYLCQKLSPVEIRLEPVYRGGRTSTGGTLDPHQAGEFVTHFLEARMVARGYGIPLSSSGSRPGSVHGPYCHIFRQVLNLVPGDVATACFKATDAPHARQGGVAIGAPNQETGRFEIDHCQVQALRQQLDIVSPECANCFNRYHCARGCPDYCLLDDAGYRLPREPGFRCRVQRGLTAALLAETAEHLWSEGLAGEARGPHGTAIL